MRVADQNLHSSNQRMGMRQTNLQVRFWTMFIGLNGKFIIFFAISYSVVNYVVNFSAKWFRDFPWCCVSLFLEICYCKLFLFFDILFMRKNY